MASTSTLTRMRLSRMINTAGNTRDGISRNARFTGCTSNPARCAARLYSATLRRSSEIGSPARSASRLKGRPWCAAINSNESESGSAASKGEAARSSRRVSAAWANASELKIECPMRRLTSQVRTLHKPFLRAAALRKTQQGQCAGESLTVTIGHQIMMRSIGIAS